MTDDAVVYVIEREPHVKIGRSTRRGLRTRLRDLQIGCPDELRLVSVVPCGRVDSARLEARVHDLLQNVRVRGEWFTLPGHLAFTYVSETHGLLLREAPADAWTRLQRRLEITLRATPVLPGD